MDKKAIAQLTELSGLKLSKSRQIELAEYAYQLFASLKPQNNLSGRKEGKTAEQLKRIFGEVKSIEELDLDLVEPAINFNIGYLTRD